MLRDTPPEHRPPTGEDCEQPGRLRNSGDPFGSAGNVLSLGDRERPSWDSTPLRDQRPRAESAHALRSANVLGNAGPSFPALDMWCGKVVFATPEAHGWPASAGFEEGKLLIALAKH